MPTQPLNVFISYSHNDEDRPLLDKLLAHLSPLEQEENRIIKTWNDAYLKPGDDWDEEIKHNLRQSEIVLLLVSADFNKSKYIQEYELKESIQRHQNGECSVVPIFLRPCDFEGMPYEKFEMLPKISDNQKLKAITEWQNQDVAFTEIVKRLREVIETLRKQKTVESDAVSTKAVDWDDPWHSFFNTSPPKRDLKLYDTVNCDRQKHFLSGLKKHYTENKSKTGNLIYFITACNTQNPESLARRLVYWFDEDFYPVFFRPDDEKRKDELIFQELELDKTKKETTWGKFWELFKKKILQQDIDFEAFVNNPGLALPIAENTRLFLSFYVSKQNLQDYDADKHIHYILKQFSRLPPDFHKFVFCFVVYFPDAHKLKEGDDASLIDLIDQLVKPLEQNPEWAAGLHLSCLPPVEEKDLKDWWYDLFDHKHFSELKTRLLPDESDAGIQHAIFDMETVEKMQYAAYTFTRDKKPL